tara:strand:- start:1156 stop:1428 length:273 start_codon:yes stop_codon:yes gene_type:complete
MKSYFITSKGVRLIAHDLFVIADKYGLNEVNLWCADAVANDIVSKADFDHDMQRDGHFVHELGIRSPQGHPLTISIDRAHCEALSVGSES